MLHLEPEDLALAALGESLSAADAAHLASCGQCTEEHRALSGAVAAGRAAGPDAGTLEAPPDVVWERVVAELGLGAQAPVSAQPVTAQPVTAQPVTSEPVAPQAAAADESPTAAPSAPIPLRARHSRRSRTPVWLAAAAAVGVVVGGAGTAWWLERPTTSVIQAAGLDALPEWPDASGEATVRQAADGSRELVVTLAGAEDAGGYHEVWLIDRDVTKLLSLGVLEGATGVFPLPDGLDLGEYPVVDVSEEPFDGNPGHSGASIVRGVLDV